jgi:hypothetical protein
MATKKPDCRALASKLYELSKDVARSTMLIPDADLPADGHLGSRLGNVLALGVDETWPTTAEGVPLDGLMQVDLTALPYVPPELQGLAFLTVFWDQDGLGDGGSVALVREYTDLTKLRPVNPSEALPSERDAVPVHLVEWVDCFSLYHLLQLVPDFSEQGDEFFQELDRELGAISEETQGDVMSSKVGGWPAPTQEPVARPVTLQVASDYDIGLNLVDGGSLYCWRVQTPDGWKWEFELQFL